ncbi:MAG: DegT/DnrJ/EryC1/StrS family aminotransferase [Myxococcota bacterium]|nr:DegT/DnrJ/EryC1/StrS family aminotransferase [Myxococcota bacterium]
MSRSPDRIPFLDLVAQHAPIQEALDQAWRDVSRSGQYILGPQVARFEADFAAYCGTEHAIGVGSGLDALHLVLRAWDLGPGDEVIVPANTYIATWLAVSLTGATPVPVEPTHATANLDVSRVEAAVTPRTRAVVPVHFYGQPVDMDPLKAIAGRHDLMLLEDAAQSHGARYRGQRTGGLGDAGAFSLYPGKNLGALGDGGIITTDDDALADRLRALRNYGSPVKYAHSIQGVNSRLDALQAALLSVKLPHLDSWNQRRRSIAHRYLEGLADIEELTLPLSEPWAEHVWHLFVVRHPRRDALQAALADRGVEAFKHYPRAPHQCGAYAGLVPPDTLPITEGLAASLLSLPVGPHLDDAAVDAVIDRVQDAARSI